MRPIFSPRLWKELIAVLAAVLYGTLLAVMLLNIQGRISIESTDTFTYADTARQIANGEGLTTKIIQPFVDAPQMPQVTWPPLLSLLVAIPLVFGVSLSQAMLTTPVVVLAIAAAVFVWYVARRWGLLPALLFAVFSLTSAPLLHVASQPMTEAVFFGLSLVAAIVAFEIMRRPWSRGTLALSIVLGILLASLGLLRYLGFALAPGVWLLFVLTKKWRPLLWSLLAFGLVAVPLLFRNFILDREFTNKRFPTDAGFWLNIQDAFVGMGKDFYRYLLWHIIRAVAALSLCALALWFAARRRVASDPSLLRFGWLLIWLAFVYLAGMVVMRSFFFFDKLNTPRFVAPVEWLALAGFCLLAAELLRRVRWLAWAVAIVVLVYGIRTVPQLYREPRHDRLPVSGRQVQWVSENTERDSLILSNHAHAYNFFLGRTAVALRQYREPNSVAELKSWTDNWRGVFPNTYIILTKELDSGRHTDLTVALSKGEQIPDFLEPLPSAPTSVFAYRARQ